MTQQRQGEQPEPVGSEPLLPHTPADDREEIYYEGSPLLRGRIAELLLWGLIGTICLAVFVVAAVRHWGFPWWVDLLLIALGLFFWSMPALLAKTVRYRVSNYRIDIERGVLSKSIDTLELWHVEDIRFHQTLLNRLLGVGTITIISHDDTTPQLLLSSVPRPRPLFETLKQRIIAVKRQRGVIKMDIGN